MSAKKDLKINARASFRMSLRFKDSEQNILPVAGYTVKAQIKKNHDDVLQLVDTLITQTGAEPDANIVYAKNFPSNITVAEVQALDGITGNIQAQIDGIDIPELTKGAVESVLTGQITSHSHEIPALTKSQVESALTGEINSHSHAIPTHDHTTSTATWTAAQT
ncbi:MAG: hypothetical protein EOL93_12050, partial [Epsilonproteobacteria bacterium]|nr:hypothetical protein [Campylobacterota bacterium]